MTNVVSLEPRRQLGQPLTKKQLADELGRSVRWIEYRQDEGLPTHRWTNRTHRFYLAEVLEWLEERNAA